jgi:integrase
MGVLLTRNAYFVHCSEVISEYVFTSFAGRGNSRTTEHHMSVVSGWRAVRRYAEKLGLEHIKPHDFRRFVATQLCKRSPRQAQLALGHTNIASTYRYYVLDELENGVTEGLF